VHSTTVKRHFINADCTQAGEVTQACRKLFRKLFRLNPLRRMRDTSARRTARSPLRSDRIVASAACATLSATRSFHSVHTAGVWWVHSAFFVPGDLDLWFLTLTFKLIRAKDQIGPTSSVWLQTYFQNSPYDIPIFSRCTVMEQLNKCRWTFSA